MLLLAKNLPQPALGAIAGNGVADCGGGSDDADARRWPRNGGTGLAAFPPDGEGATIDPTAGFAYRANFVLPPQMLLGAETHGP